MKLSIIGAGRVGTAIAFAAISGGLGAGSIDEIVLVGRTAASTLGDALDLRHASCFIHPAEVVNGEMGDSKNSDIVIISAAAANDLNDRRKSASPNVALFREIVPQLARLSPGAVLIIVTNPVDVLTQIAQDVSGLPRGRVLGTGTIIDTVRLRAMLAERIGVHPIDLRVYVIGEHGVDQIAALSSASVGGAPLEFDPAELKRLAKEAGDAGIRVAREKGYTNHAVAMATMMIVDAIAKDSRAVLPVSTRLENYCGVSDLCLSVPAVVGREGVIRTLQISLSEEEASAFRKSAMAVRAVLDASR